MVIYNNLILRFIELKLEEEEENNDSRYRINSTTVDNELTVTSREFKVVDKVKYAFLLLLSYSNYHRVYSISRTINRPQCVNCI